MPKKKTGQRKKAEKQKLRQKEIRSQEKNIAEYPCKEIKVLTQEKYLKVSTFQATQQWSATNANESRNLERFATSAPTSSDSPCAHSAESRNA